MSGTLPSAEEWAAKCGLTRRGREWVGPCPSCGGTDRFHVTDRRAPPAGAAVAASTGTPAERSKPPRAPF